MRLGMILFICIKRDPKKCNLNWSYWSEANGKEYEQRFLVDLINFQLL